MYPTGYQQGYPPPANVYPSGPGYPGYGSPGYPPQHPGYPPPPPSYPPSGYPPSGYPSQGYPQDPSRGPPGPQESPGPSTAKAMCCGSCAGCLACLLGSICQSMLSKAAEESQNIGNAPNQTPGTANVTSPQIPGTPNMAAPQLPETANAPPQQMTGMASVGGAQFVDTPSPQVAENTTQSWATEKTLQSQYIVDEDNPRASDDDDDDDK